MMIVMQPWEEIGGGQYRKYNDLSVGGSRAVTGLMTYMYLYGVR